GGGGGAGVDDRECRAGGHVHDPHRPVLAGGGDGLAVGAEGQAVDLAELLAQREDDPAAVGVPDDDLAGLVLVAAAAGGQPLAVGAEGDAADRGGVSRGRGYLLPPGHVP